MTERRLIAGACVLVTLCGLCSPQSVHAQTAAERPIPRIVEKDGRHALFVDDAPFLILGAQVHNSSAWPSVLPKVWPAMEFLHVNTVEMPVYWEQIEPKQGQFDFSIVDSLIKECRAHNVRLVLLWFGTWKNGSAHYRPEWMKRDPEKYPNIIGKNGQAVDSPSPHSAEALQADIAAFTALMKHLKEVDAQRTVLMVQVENEPGAWGTVRDYSPEAQKLFESPVPAELLQGIKKEAAANANWSTVFGEDAEEFFHAYSVADYIGQVAAAGKAVYPLPLYVNAALRDPLTPSRPPRYESGGATDNVLHIWKAAAPAIDILAPDIYMSGSAKIMKVLELYHRPDNALFIPEIAGNPDNAKYFYAALGNGAIGFAPFGLDYTRVTADPFGSPAQNETTLQPLAMQYRAIEPIMRPMAQWILDGKVQAAVEREEKTTPILTFGDWNVIVGFGAGGVRGVTPNEKPVGRVVVAQLGEGEFIVSGFYTNLQFRPTAENAKKPWQFLKVEEGAFQDGVFKANRIWNGDETDWGINFVSQPEVLRITVSTR